jgi:hypothetical protein
LSLLLHATPTATAIEKKTAPKTIGLRTMIGILLANAPTSEQAAAHQAH